MGLGKTIQSIGFMACLQAHLNKKGPFLVVVPLSVLSNWISEIERFCPSFRAVRFHGMYCMYCMYVAGDVYHDEDDDVSCPIIFPSENTVHRLNNSSF